MPFPAYLQFSLSSSELFLTFRWYKQISWVPIRCSLVLHLFNDSCFQKRSQPHSWLSVPAVPSALDLAEVVGQIWWKTTWVKTATKSHSLPVPSDSPVVGFSPGKGTGPWSRDRLREGTQTAGSDRAYGGSRENVTWSSCGDTPWVGKVWCEHGFRQINSHLWLREHSPCPLTSGRYHRRCFHLQCLRDVLIKKKKNVDTSFYFC